VSSVIPKGDGSIRDEVEDSENILDELETDHRVVDNAVPDFANNHPMNSDISDAERKLLDEICFSEGDLDNFEQNLNVADEALKALAEEKFQYDALKKVCGSLEELDELGARDLFWGKRPSDAGFHAEMLEQARDRIQDFETEVWKAERQRQAVIDKIGDQNLLLDALDARLREAMELEERRRAEWIIENEPRELSIRQQIMPWARLADEDKRFRQSVAATMLVAILVGLLLPMIDLPIPLRSELTEVPERVAKVIREEIQPPPPQPVAEQPVIEEEPVEPELVEELVPEAVIDTPEVPVVAAVEPPKTREQVKTKGILAFRDSFASRSLDRPNANLGSQATVRNAGEQAVGRPERSMVSTSAPGSSGGINLSDLSRDVGGGGQGIEGVGVARVASAIGSGDGPDRPLSSGQSAGRTDEEIQIVFDRYKSALYRLYNRELRRDPTLRGQLVLRLTIDPDGSVSMCEVRSSDMEAPTLAQQVVDRVRGFDFGAKDDIAAVTIVYPIDFLPAG
jgi:outer membrane biosynthesis protein TonB